jgi:hypothetical protein
MPWQEPPNRLAAYFARLDRRGPTDESRGREQERLSVHILLDTLESFPEIPAGDPVVAIVSWFSNLGPTWSSSVGIFNTVDQLKKDRPNVMIAHLDLDVRRDLKGTDEEIDQAAEAVEDAIWQSGAVAYFVHSISLMVSKGKPALAKVYDYDGNIYEYEVDPEEPEEPTDIN